MADADMFSGMKKVKKSKKQVALDDLEPAAEEKPAPTPAAAPAEVAGSDNTQAAVEPKTEATPEAPAAAPSAGDDLDFSDLKKKKKSKKVQLDLDDLESPAAEAETAPADGAPEAVPEDFTDLKKKKKKGSKKSAFDLEAFEKELAATESAEKEAADAGAGPQDADDNAEGQDEDDEDVPEGEDPFAKEGGAGDEGKSKCELAFDRKGWLTENRDYQYEELLGRFYSQLYASHPGLSGNAKKRYTIPPPSMLRDGNKRSIFANVADICKKMRRSPEHVIQFLFAELGTTGSVDASSRLVIKGRFQQKQIESVLRRYIVEYVTCKTCKSPDTLLEKDNRLYFVTCNSCQSRRSVASITSGYKALTSKRKAMAAKQG